jgi:hypothetical protein
MVGNHCVYASSDGTTWDSVDLSNIDVGWYYGVAFGSGTWVVVGNDPSNYTQILASQNGTNWSSRLAPGSYNALLDVAFDGAGQFVAVGGAGVFTSSDGMGWTRRTGSGYLANVAYGDGTWVATPSDSWSSEGVRAFVSNDTIEWQTIDVPARSLATDSAGNWLGARGRAVLRRTSIPGL